MSARGLKLVALSVLLGGTAVLLSGCSWSEALALGWPEGITPEARVNRELWIGSLIAALVVGVIVYILLFWAVVFHRKKKDETDLPRQFGYNMPLELALTVTPFLIIAVLFYFTVVVQEKMLHKDPNPEVVIDVTAFQWNWKFGYQKIDFADGTFSYDGADDARKEAMISKPEGVDKHGEELVGPIRGDESRGPHIPELRQGGDARLIDGDPGAGGAGWQAGRIPDRLGRRDPRFLGARVPVQARRAAGSQGEQLRQHLPGQRDQPARGRTAAHSSAGVPRCAAPITR